MRFIIVALALMAMFSTASEICDNCVALYYEQGGCGDSAVQEKFTLMEGCSTCITQCNKFCNLPKCDQAMQMISSDGFCKATFAGNVKGVDFAIGYPNVNLVSTLPMWSASKLVTSSFVLKLSERRMVRLDKPVGNYIKWWTLDPSDNRSKVTLRHLLSLTSGFGDASCSKAQTDKNFNFDELTPETCAHWIYDNFFGNFKGEYALMPTPEEEVLPNEEVIPGKFAQYTESSFHLILHIIEAEIEQTWTDLFQRYFNYMLDIDEKNCYWSDNYKLTGPGASLVCSIGAYLKFLKARHEGDYLRSRSLEEQQTNWVKEFGATEKGWMAGQVADHVGYGLGCWVSDCDEDNYCNLIDSFGAAGALPFSNADSYGFLGRYEFDFNVGAGMSLSIGFALFDIFESMSEEELKECSSDINKEVDYYKHGMDHEKHFLTGTGGNGLSLGLCDPPKQEDIDKDLTDTSGGANIVDDPCDTCVLYFYAEEGCKHIEESDFNPIDYVPPSCHHLLSTKDSQCTQIAKLRCKSGKPIYKYTDFMKKKEKGDDDIIDSIVPAIISPFSENAVSHSETDQVNLFTSTNMTVFCLTVGIFAIILKVYAMRKKQNENQNNFEQFLDEEI